MSNSIKNWATDERPREKMLLKGMAALSDTELLAILINNGSKEKSALALAKEVYAMAQNNFAELSKLSVQTISKNIKGIGPAKAVTICAALEIGRRRQMSEILELKKITSQIEAINLLKPLLADKGEEQFAVIFLNNSNAILHHQIMAIGGYTSCTVDVRIILKKAIELQANKLIIAHNHPSGNVTPSKSDISITEKIKEAGTFLEIELVDHLIITNNLTYSFANDGKL